MEKTQRVTYWTGGKMIEFVSFISLFLTGILLIVIWNLWVFRKRNYKQLSDNEMPFISVLIPARNEERSIRKCVESLLIQDYPNYEVIVLNDNSEDMTLDILKDIQINQPKLHVINGKPLEEGWTGKNFACHQLYLHSKGEYILFSDADTVHFNNSLRNAVIRAVNRKADLYSLIPSMTLETFAEKCIMPGMHFTSFTLLPYYLAENLKSPVFAMGVGPYMLFKRDSYEKIGGHESIKSHLVEDVALAKSIKKHGLKVVVNKGLDILSCRMYHSFGEIWEGFSKNIFPGMNYNSFLLFAVFTVYLLLFFVPFVGLVISAAVANELLMYNFLYQSVLVLLMRLLINTFFKLGIVSTLLHPIGIFIISTIGFNSWRWNKLGKGSVWKGRTYSPVNPKGDNYVL